MSCKNPEISDQILAWVDGALSPAEEKRFSAHVDACAACQADAEALRSITARVQRAYGLQRRAPVLAACPLADELADFAAATAPPNRAMAIEAHLVTCPRCSEDVEVMREIDGAPAETERVAPPPLPASLRDAFCAAAAPAVTGASSRSPAPLAMPRGRGDGWGMRRVLAAVATLTVLIGMTSLFVMRPDIFGAHQPGSDVVSQPTRQLPAPAAPAPVGAASGAVNSGGGAEPYSPAASASDLKSSKVASAKERAVNEDGKSPTEDEARAVRPSAAPTSGVAAAGKSEAAARRAQPTDVAVAPTPRPADSTAPTSPPAPASVVAAAKPVPAPPLSPAKSAAVAAPRAAPPTPAVSSAAPSAPVVHPALPAQPPAPAIMSKKGDGHGSVMTPPIPPQETRAAPVFAKVAPTVGRATVDKASAAEKDAAPASQTESKAAPRSEAKAVPRNNGVEAAPDARPARPSGAIARTSTSNVVVSQRTQPEDARRDGERDRYTQSADDTLRGGADSQAGGAGPAPAAPAAPTVTAPTLSSGSARSTGYGGNAPAAAPQGGVRGTSSGTTYSALVAYRVRQTMFQMLGTHDFTVRVTVDPSEASSAGQARRIRVDVVLRGGSSATAASIRREVVRAVPLDLQRGDEVVVTHE